MLSPHSPLHPHLAKIHHELGRFLVPMARNNLMEILRVIVANPHTVQAPFRMAQVERLLIPAHRLATLRSYLRFNPRLEVIEVAPALLTLLDLEDAQPLLGYGWETLIIDPAALARTRNLWVKAVQDHNGFADTLDLRTATGRRLTVRSTVMPLRTPCEPDTLLGWFAHIQRVAKVLKIDPSSQRAKQISA